MLAPFLPFQYGGSPPLSGGFGLYLSTPPPLPPFQVAEGGARG